jgi:hypothetical protein
MRLKLKHLSWCALAFFSALAFFGIFSWPHDSKAAMTLLDKIDNAVFRPAAHPTMFALVVGLAIGTVLLPEIWRVVRDHAFPTRPQPNMDMAAAIEYLLVRSRWAVGRLYYDKRKDQLSSLTGLLDEDLDVLIRDAAAQNRVTIWGRPSNPILFGSPIEIEIKPSEWTEIPFDLTTMADYDAPHGVVARDRRISEDRYWNLRVNRREVHREWPPASYFRLIFDKTWKGRKERTCDEE